MGPADQSVAIGVIGLGRIGFIHAENLALRLRGGRLAAVADAQPDRARETGRSLGVPWSGSHEAIIGDEQIAGVVIATPAPTHGDLVAQAASAGKHVFCEKPLAVSLEDTRSAVNTVEAAGVVFQVGFHTRFDAQVAAVGGGVREGVFGEPMLLHARLRDMEPPPEAYLQGSGNLLVDGAIHLFDLATWLGGEVAEVTAVGTDSVLGPSPAQDESTIVLLRFRSGGRAILENSRRAGYAFDFSAELVGSRCTARVDAGHEAQVQWLRAGQVARELPRDFTDRFQDAYRAELQAFINSIARLEAPVPGTADAIRAALLADAAIRSIAERRTIALPAPEPGDAAPIAGRVEQGSV